MTTVTRTAGTRFTRIILIATAALAAVLFVFPAPARADGGHGHGNEHGHSNGHGRADGNGHYDGRSNGPVHGYEGYRMVPRSIVMGQRGYYQPYYSGRVYYAPHLAFGINFGSPGGVSFGGFYSSPGYVAPAPYPYVAYQAPPPYYGPDVYYRGRHCDHGDGDYDGD